MEQRAVESNRRVKRMAIRLNVLCSNQSKSPLLLVFVINLMLCLRFVFFPVIADDTFEGTD
jgi:hypothetical protein